MGSRLVEQPEWSRLSISDVASGLMRTSRDYEGFSAAALGRYRIDLSFSAMARWIAGRDHKRSRRAGRNGR